MDSNPEAPPPTQEVMEVTHSRLNGWVCPWHPLQLLGWFFVLFFTVAHFGFLVFYTPEYWRIFTYVVSVF